MLAQLQLLFFSALAFVWLNKQGLYPPELHSVNLDAEWIYRKVLPRGAGLVSAAMESLAGGARTLVTDSIQQTRDGFGRSRWAAYHLSASWPTGSMVLWIAVLLGVYLLLDTFF